MPRAQPREDQDAGIIITISIIIIIIISSSSSSNSIITISYYYIQALRALTSVFYCGVWKHNFEILQILMAWQDPNKVPIKQDKLNIEINDVIISNILKD